MPHVAASLPVVHTKGLHVPQSPSSSEDRQTKPPEKKIGPFAAGVGVAIWINEAENGKQFRSITIAPRRYFDEKSKQWKDAPSFNPADLPALVFALQQAQAYCYTTPLPSEANGQDEDVPN